MTREEMAARLLEVQIDCNRHVDIEHADMDVISDAAAELRKTCGTCEHWDLGHRHQVQHCRKGQDAPFDGSGFCHAWTAKEPL